MLLGAGEVRERGAEALGLEHAEIHLDPLAVADGGLRLAPLEDLRGLGECGEGVHHLRGTGGRDEDVDVADGLLHAPEGARELDRLDAGDVPEGADELLAERERAAERHAGLAAPDERDPLQDVRLGLRLDAVEPAELARPRQLLQAVEAGDALMLVEELRGLGADARHVHEVRDPAGDPPLRGLDVLDAARPEVLDDLPREVLPHPRDLLETLLARERLHVLGERLEVLGGAPVGTDAERVLLLDLEDVRHQVEEARELEVLHRYANAHL